VLHQRLGYAQANTARSTSDNDHLFVSGISIHSSNKTGLNYWKGKAIIPFTDWMSIKNNQYALQYFPDDFDELWICTSQEELEQGLKREDAKKWNSDYLELMEYTKNANYGKLKCFHCLLSPAGDGPIFIGVNRLVAKGLGPSPPEYPCRVVSQYIAMSV
jgi:hypothetical protein